MIIRNTKILLFLTVVLVFFYNKLLAQKPQGKNKIYNTASVIIPQIDEVLGGGGLDSTLKNKLAALKENLVNFQRDSADNNLIEKIKISAEFKQKENIQIKSKYSELVKNIELLKKQIGAYLGKSTGKAKESNQKTDAKSNDTTADTLNSGTAVALIAKNCEVPKNSDAYKELESKYNELESNYTGLKIELNGTKVALEASKNSKDFQQKLFYILFLVFLFNAITFFFFKNKTQQKLKLEYTKLKANYLNLIDQIDTKNKLSPAINTTPKSQVELVQQTAVPLIENIPTKGNYFFAEAMVTAGPRKNFDTDAKEGDYGLGEDVAGLVIKKDIAFFWVLDGTSDSDKLSKPLFTNDAREEEYFSSRLLAQSIGWNLQQLIADRLPPTFNATQLLQEAITVTEKEWQSKIRQLDTASYEALENAILDKNGILQCSTTVVFGALHLDGRLDVCRIGDTKIIAQPSENDFAKSTGRQFATLQQIDNNVKLSFNDFSDVRSQSIQLNNISNLLVMTDGISNQMEAWLKSSNLNFTDKNTREILTRFKQKTYDDKALCIIQIKKDS